MINKHIHIGGNNEDGDITINGDRNGSVFTIDSDGDSLSVHFFGIRIIDGRSEKGGGLFARNTYVEIRDCKVLNNQTAGEGSQGGGIYAYNAILGIFNSDISENNSDDLPGFGAGIYVDGSEIQISDSWIECNNSSIIFFNK